MENDGMTREDSQVDASSTALLIRMDGKLDALTTEVGTIKTEVTMRKTYCEQEHKLVDKTLAEDRSRIMSLEKAQQGDQSAKDKARGAWATVMLIGGSLVAGGGLVLAAVQLWR